MRRVVASDGGAQSALWMQIAADALDDWDGIDRFVTPAGVVEPDPATAGAYDEHYALFRVTYERLRPLYPRLAGAAGAVAGAGEAPRRRACWRSGRFPRR
jgi:sugar (pentulose or hexulose) kinase